MKKGTCLAASCGLKEQVCGTSHCLETVRTTLPVREDIREAENVGQERDGIRFQLPRCY